MVPKHHHDLTISIGNSGIIGGKFHMVFDLFPGVGFVDMLDSRISQRNRSWFILVLYILRRSMLYALG